jgi:hypothetical protein
VGHNGSGSHTENPLNHQLQPVKATTTMGFGNAPSKDNAQGIPTFLGLSGRPLSLLVSIVATNGFLLFGYDQGVMSGIISAPDFNNAFPETRGDSTWQGFVTAIYGT